MRSRLRAAALAAAFALLAPAPATAEEEVRIALTSGRARVEVAGPALSIFDAESGARLAGAPGEASFELRAVAGGLEVREGGERDDVLASAKRLLIESDEQVRVEGAVYFGRLEVVPEKGRPGSLLVINRLPLETYLLGIVGSEMSPAWPIEALKAQAVAARTYAMQRRRMMRAANEPYDLASTVLSQVYKGAERIRPSVIEAVKATRGEVMAFDHELVEALFHSTCGGQTASAREIFGRDVPYLRARACSFCRDSDRYRWKLSYSLADLSAKLGAARLASSPVLRFERPAGAAKVSLKEKKGQKAASPKDVRAALGYMSLYSERFTAHTAGKKVLFDGHGFGHGVGLCQWGARGMAEAGHGHQEILEHYYRGARLLRMY
jgi:stage II sporulation protein D